MTCGVGQQCLKCKRYGGSSAHHRGTGIFSTGVEIQLLLTLDAFRARSGPERLSGWRKGSVTVLRMVWGDRSRGWALRCPWRWDSLTAILDLRHLAFQISLPCGERLLLNENSRSITTWISDEATKLFHRAGLPSITDLRENISVRCSVHRTNAMITCGCELWRQFQAGHWD